MTGSVTLRNDIDAQAAVGIIRERLDFIASYLELTKSATDHKVIQNRYEFTTARNQWSALALCVKNIRDVYPATVEMLGQMEYCLDDTLRKLKDFNKSQLLSMQQSLELARKGRQDQLIIHSTGIAFAQTRIQQQDIDALLPVIDKLTQDIQNIDNAEKGLIRWAYHGTGIDSITHDYTKKRRHDRKADI